MKLTMLKGKVKSVPLQTAQSLMAQCLPKRVPEQVGYIVFCDGKFNFRSAVTGPLMDAIYVQIKSSKNRVHFLRGS